MAQTRKGEKGKRGGYEEVERGKERVRKRRKRRAGGGDLNQLESPFHDGMLVIM